MLGIESVVRHGSRGSVIPHALPRAVGPLMVTMIESAFRAPAVAGLGRLHRAAAGDRAAARRAVRVAAVARRTDGEQATAAAAGLLAERLVHGVGARAAISDWTASPNRGTTGPTGSVCRSSRRSRGSGGRVRALILLPANPVRYPKDRADTTAAAVDADAPVDAHTAPTRCLQNRTERRFAQAPTAIIVFGSKKKRNEQDTTVAAALRQSLRFARFQVSADMGRARARFSAGKSPVAQSTAA